MDYRPSTEILISEKRERIDDDFIEAGGWAILEVRLFSPDPTTDWREFRIYGEFCDEGKESLREEWLNNYDLNEKEIIFLIDKIKERGRVTLDRRRGCRG